MKLPNCSSKYESLWYTTILKSVSMHAELGKFHIGIPNENVDDKVAGGHWIYQWGIVNFDMISTSIARLLLHCTIKGGSITLPQSACTCKEISNNNNSQMQ